MTKYNFITQINKAHIIWALLIACLCSQAQNSNNLVPNYSFESYVVCPHLSYPPPPAPWYIPTNNNPVYLNACDTSVYASVPINRTKGYSFQYARTGRAYIYLDYENGPSLNLRTYIQVKLIDSLKIGHCYYAEHVVNVPNPLKYACNNIGMLFTDTAVYADTAVTNGPVIPANPQIINYGNPIIIDTLNWIKVSGVFTAQGGEHYLTLGNFKYDNQTTHTTIQPIGYNGAGYYIDDVSVYELDSFSLKADAGRDTTIIKGDSVFIGSYTNGITNVRWYDATGQVIDSVQPGFWVKPLSNTFYVIEQNVCGQYSRDTVNITVNPLPVVLLSFNVSGFKSFNGNTNTLVSWETASEVNVGYFNVQRSTDGNEFSTIGEVKAKGAGSYSYLDNTNLTGIVYYRLEIVDKDGRKSYSEIRQLRSHDIG